MNVLSLKMLAVRESNMDDELSDRISDLPRDVIDIILNHLSLREAVRTSILSTSWRLHWTRKENLILDSWSITKSLHGETKAILASKYQQIVSGILLSHHGHIRKFLLDFPIQMEITPTLDVINQWILAVSRCGVQELTLDLNYKFDHRLPSYLFQCVELKHLCIYTGEHSPYSFKELPSLISLDLRYTYTDGDSLASIVLNCPLLERLSLSCSSNSGPFTINASKLKFLRIKYCFGFDLVLENTPSLSTILLDLTGYPKEGAQTKCQGMLDFFGAVPNIENVTVTADVLVEWGKQHVLERLPSLHVQHLTSLTVCRLNIYSRVEICSFFCLLRSSPKLQALNISMWQSHLQPPDTGDYIIMQTSDANFNSLRTLKITVLTDMEADIVFCEAILSRCPVLEKFYMKVDYSVSDEAESKMATDFMRFSQASSPFEIIYPRTDAWYN